jgi:hypothetical protein
MDATTQAKEVYLEAIKKLKRCRGEERDAEKRQLLNDEIDQFYGKLEDVEWMALSNRTAALTELCSCLRAVVTRAGNVRTISSSLDDLTKFSDQVTQIINPPQA